MGNLLFCCPHKKPAKLDLKIAIDLENRTSFTHEEIKTLFETFQSEYPSLRMSKDQFIEKIQTEVLPIGDCNLFANYLYKIFDANGNGTIDFTEFIYGLFLLTSATGKERLEFAFKMLDVNGDGYVTQQEMRQVLEAYSVFGGSEKRESPEYRVSFLKIQIFAIKMPKWVKEVILGNLGVIRDHLS